MSALKLLIQKHWQDDHGTVISLELLSFAVIALIGMVVGFTSLRDAAISELSDVAGAFQDVTQCYSFNALVGHSSDTHGSSFVDATDHCDQPEDPFGGLDNCIVLTAPEDEEGGDDGGGSEPVGSEPLALVFEGEGDEVQTTTGGPYSDGWIVWSNGQIFVDVEIPEDGLYKFSANLWGQQGGPDLPNAAFLVDGLAIDDFDIAETSHAMAGEYCVEVFLTAGTHQFAVEFTNDFFVPPNDRNLFVDYLQVTGPN